MSPCGRYHPSPSIPLPVEGRGKRAASRSGFSTGPVDRLTNTVGPNNPQQPLSFPSPLNAERARVRGGIAVETSRFFKVWLALAACFPIMLSAATFTETFSTDPAANGWQAFGNTNLFHWDSTNQNLRVTWDSSQTNSYFYRPLGTILTRDDDFNLSFELTFEDYASGTTPSKPFAAPATVGFLNLDQATHTNFARGAGINPDYGPKNLVEFNFFPAFDVFLPTIGQVIVSTNNAWLYNTDNLMEMTPGETFNVHMDYVAATRTLTTVVTNSGAQYGLTQTIHVPTNFDFRVATLSVSSYSDVRDIGSVLAHGTVDNLIVVTPPPPLENLSGQFIDGIWETEFASRINWLYALERTTNFTAWDAAVTDVRGNGHTLILTDTNPPAANVFYRVRANRP